MVFAEDKTEARNKDDFESVFGPTRVWGIHLRGSAENCWKTIQPAGGGFPGFATPPVGVGLPNPGVAFRRGSFGFEFEDVKADVELDGRSINEVCLRFKWNGSDRLSAAGRKDKDDRLNKADLTAAFGPPPRNP